MLAEITQNGIRVNSQFLKKNRTIMDTKIEDNRKDIFLSQEYKIWDKQTEFNPLSPDDLKYLLFEKLKFEPTAYTDHENPSLDKKALETIDIPITHSILEYKRMLKGRDTYLHQFDVEQMKNIIRGSFSVGTTKSYRSSSYNPGLQNVPIRDEEIRDLVRGIIVPRWGNFFQGWDYKSIEVIVAALVTGDSNLLKYVQDLSTDMHRDLAMQLFFLEKDDVKKLWRYWAKNKFVFAEFYGSYWGHIAPELWEVIESDSELREHIRDFGIDVYEDYEEHIKDVEDDFWNNRFYEYSQFKIDLVKRYNKDGYIDSLTGFRYWGEMNDREVCNYPIQGSAFHILLWSMIQIQKELKKMKVTRTRLVSEIHDQIISDTHPEDEDLMDHLVWKWSTQKVREHWDWITVPLILEKATAGINRPWSELTDIGFLDDPYKNVA